MKQYLKTSLGIVAAGVISMAALVPSASYALSQEETIYAKLQPSGSEQYIKIARHLVDETAAERINDYAISDKMEDKDLPVTVEVTYKLNGEAKTVEEILGQAGQVELEFKFTNHAKVGALYTPFVVALTTTLNEDNVRNVQVTNGKAISNGRTMAVAAVAAPGLYESLQLDELKNLDTVTLNYETDKFELNDVYALVTPKLLDAADLDMFDKLDGLYDNTEKLAESSKQLVAGTQDLKAGIEELRAGVMAAQQKLSAMPVTIDTATMEQIKAQAGQAAAEKVLAQEPMIRAQIRQQLANSPLANMPGVEEMMVQSSLQLAQATAKQTAELTAETVATQVAKTMQSEVGKALGVAFDTMLVGINQLVGGANQLATGMAEFDQAGIQSLNNVVNGKLKTTTRKIEQLTKLAEQYDNFAGKNGADESTTKFVLMIEGRK